MIFSESISNIVTRRYRNWKKIECILSGRGKIQFVVDTIKPLELA